MKLTELTDRELREVISERLNFSEHNDSAWDQLKGEDMVGRTQSVLLDMIEDIDAQITIRRSEDSEWGKKAIWYRSLLRRRMAQVKSAVKKANVSGMLLAQEWQSIALHLAQAIARHEADLSDSPEDVGDGDTALWSMLDSEKRVDGTSLRHWLINTIPPKKYRDAD